MLIKKWLAELEVLKTKIERIKKIILAMWIRL